MAEKKNYRVDHGKTQVHTRFQKGVSGNPKGRPRKKKVEFDTQRELRAVFMKVATTPVRTKIDGKVRKIPALEAMYLQLVTRAIEGHAPSIRLVHKITHDFIQDHEDWQAKFYELSWELLGDLKVLEGEKEREETLRLLRQALEQVDLKIADQQ